LSQKHCGEECYKTNSGTNFAETTYHIFLHGKRICMLRIKDS
jgi:hypothetical protein